MHRGAGAAQQQRDRDHHHGYQEPEQQHGRIEAQTMVEPAWSAAWPFGYQPPMQL
jgi:hypothetical protein